MIPFPFQTGQLGRRRPVAGGGGGGAFNSFQATPVPGGTSSGTLSNSNRRWTTNVTSGSNGNFYTPIGALPSGKKAYWEITVVTLSVPDSSIGYIQCNIGSAYIWYVYTNQRQVVGAGTTNIDPGASGMVLMFAADDAAGKSWFGRNGTWINTGSGTPDPAAGTGQAASFTPGSGPILRIEGRTGSVAQVADCNFGHTAFAYTPPTGFSSINE